MNNVVVVGFMGSGKSTVGPLLAARLQRPFIDLDTVIESEAGMPLGGIFARDGEAGFRRREREAVERVTQREREVIAVGGGAPLNPDNWRRLRAGNCVVALTASRRTLAARLDGVRDRPLLEGGVDAALDQLLPARTPRYLAADLVIDTDPLTPVAVAEAIAGALPDGALERVEVRIPGAAHEITIGARLQGLIGPALRRVGVTGGVAIATDASVGPRHAPAVETALRAAGFHPQCHAFPSGEAAKTMDAVRDFYRFLGEHGIDRQGAVIALGGGAVGDAAGFAAATWLRGVPLLHLPTTLLAMVDSSIGGKNGINLEAGKNLVGTVHQPCAILIDTAYLETLPEREYRAAWAEIIKSGIIADTELFETVLKGRSAISARDPHLLQDVIARTCAVKARVVAADPFEQGDRAILNYGHTVGHALEAALGYGAIPHGEAVAWGMQVAADLSVSSGRCAPQTRDRQAEVLRAYGLLDTRPRIDRTRLLEAMRHDKKRRDGEIGWVLLEEIGRAVYGCRVAWSDVEASLDAVLPA
jgi:shikimate kinase / 3-dehydroquinate synthase